VHKKYTVCLVKFTQVSDLLENAFILTLKYLPTFWRH